MKPLKLIILGISLLLCCPSIASAQQIVPRHEGLASDTEYMELLKREVALTTAADSISSVIAECRKIIAENPEKRDTYSSDILRLESELFDIRNNLGMVTSRTNIIEQEYIVRNMSAINRTEEPETKDFFDENLSEGEKAALRSVGATDSLFMRLSLTLKEAVAHRETLYNGYMSATDKRSADSISVMFDTATADIARLDRELSDRWIDVYDTLRYAYERLLDKINTPSSMMEPVLEMSRNLRSKRSEAPAHYAAPALAMYGRQKRMLATYEKLLADRLQMTETYDSLAKVLARPRTDGCDYRVLVLPELVFVDFAPVKIGAAGAMSNSNPPKPLTVPSRGEFFKIELLTNNGMLSDYRSLRNINNVEYREIAGDKYVYYAGSYRLRDEAARDCDRVRRTGLKARVAAWRDGVPVDENGVAIEERPVGDIFRVVVYSMDDTARGIIKEIAPDKDLLATETDDQTVISVGPFEEYEKALFLAKSLPKAKVVGQKTETE